jgi:predicted esterase
LDPEELAALQRNRGRIRRVYLITGEDDVVCDETEKVRGWLRKAGIPVRVSTPSDMGHRVALESKAAMYKAAISWLGG